MRKSAQGGWRVSGMRVDSDDLRGSVPRRTMDRRGSGIPQPGFASKGRRSSSETRDSRMSALPASMKRSKSQINIHLTPAPNPTTPMRGIPPVCYGSTQSQRFGASPFSDGGRSSRMSAYSGIGGLPGKPARVVKDTRPLADKAYQQQQIQKITGFLHSQPNALEIAPKGINLRQLTLKLFVDLVNYLMSFLASNANVNTTNYVTEIPLILKRWGYVGNLNTSWLKTVNTPHALPHVLGVLSWLTTCAIAVTKTDYEAVLQDSLSSADDESFPYGNAAIYVQHLIKQYPLWNSANVVAEERQERLFIEDLCNRNGVSDEEMKQVAEEIRNLEAQLNDPKEKAEMEAAKEDERKYNEFMKDYNSCVAYKTQMEEFLNSAESLLEEENLKLQKDEECRSNLQNGIIEIKDQLSRQTMTVDERDHIVRLCNELNSAIREHEEYIAVVSNQSYTDDIEMAKKRTNLQKKTQAYNTVVIKESCWLPELGNLRNDANILHQGADQELAEIDAQLLKLKSELLQKREELRSATNELKDRLHQAGERISLLRQEISLQLDSVKQHEQGIENVKARSAEETDEMKKTIQSLKSAIEAQISCGSLDAAKKQLQSLIEKREYGKNHIQNLKDRAEIFFKKSMAITQGLITNVMRAETEYLDKRDEVLKIYHEIVMKSKADINEISKKKI